MSEKDILISREFLKRKMPYVHILRSGEIIFSSSRREPNSVIFAEVRRRENVNPIKISSPGKVIYLQTDEQGENRLVLQGNVPSCRISHIEVLDRGGSYPVVAMSELTPSIHEGRIYFDMVRPFTLQGSRLLNLNTGEEFDRSEIGPIRVEFPLVDTRATLIWRPNEQRVILKGSNGWSSEKRYTEQTSRPFDEKRFVFFRAQLIPEISLDTYDDLDVIREDEVPYGKEVLTLDGKRYFVRS
jgi:hypothetical protein